MMNSESAKSDETEDALPSATARAQNFLAHLHYFLWHASTSHVDIVKWSRCGFFFQIKTDHPQFPALLAKFFPYSDTMTFLTQLKAHGIRLQPQGTDWYCHPQSYFWRDRPPVQPHWMAPSNSTAPAQASENADAASESSSTIASAQQENEVVENDKISAVIKETMENENPVVSDTRSSSCEKLDASGDNASVRTEDLLLAVTSDLIAPTLGPMVNLERTKNSLPSATAQTQKFLAHLHSFLGQASTSHVDFVQWSKCGFFFQIQFNNPQFPALLSQYFPYFDSESLLTQLQDHGFISLPQGTGWYYCPHGRFCRDIPPEHPYWNAPARPYGISPINPYRSPTGASENGENESPSTLESNARQDIKMVENEKTSAVVNEIMENEDRTVSDSGNVSASSRNEDQLLVASGDIVAPAVIPLDAQGTMEISTGGPENDETESNRQSALGSNAERELETSETEMASAAVNETMENEDTTVTDTCITSCEKKDFPVDKKDLENPDQIVFAAPDTVELAHESLNGQEMMGSSNHEVISSTATPEHSETESKTPSKLGLKSLETEDPTVTEELSAQSGKLDVPCDEAPKNGSQTVVPECKAITKADLMLLTQCNSAGEPDDMSDDKEVIASANLLSSQCSFEGDGSTENGENVLFTQYKSGDEEMLTSDDDLLSIQRDGVADETLGSGDDMLAANSSFTELTLFRYENDISENFENVLHTQSDSEQGDDPRDEMILENANQTETSSACNSDELSDAASMEIMKEQRQEQTHNRAMECDDRSKDIQHDVLKQFHAPDENTGARIPFLQRNRKRTSKRIHGPTISTLQSTLFLNQKNTAVRRTDVCAPELNIPSRKTTTSKHLHGHYRVHVLKKETNERVVTTTMSFCLPAYQCHFCVFHGSDMENIWQHCSSTHGDENLFYPLETTDGMFHLLAEQNMLSRKNTNDENSYDTGLNQPFQSRNEEPPLFKDVFRSGVSLPMRQYYHDVTFHPISLSEWLFNLKDIEYDPEWRGIVDTSALFDMTDISTTEKLFMTLWNNFMRSHAILSEIQLSSQLLSFVQEHSNVLLQCDLEEELMGHLVNMWAEGHIGQGTMLEAMKIFNSYANER